MVAYQAGYHLPRKRNTFATFFSAATAEGTVYILVNFLSCILGQEGFCQTDQGHLQERMNSLKDSVQKSIQSRTLFPTGNIQDAFGCLREKHEDYGLPLLFVAICFAEVHIIHAQRFHSAKNDE